jgi:hypothetical protein
MKNQSWTKKVRIEFINDTKVQFCFNKFHARLWQGTINFSCRELEEFKTCKLGGAYLFLMIDDILIENVVQTKCFTIENKLEPHVSWATKIKKRYSKIRVTLCMLLPFSSGSLLIKKHHLINFTLHNNLVTLQCVVH